MADKRPLIIFCTLLVLFDKSVRGEQYLGKFLGKLSELHHGVSGEIYAVDARTLHLKDFTYDGEGPAAYFWAGTTRSPGAAGFRVRDENGSGAVLKRYRRKSITLTLPDGKTLNNIKWFSVWCEEFAVNFGDVKIPRNFDYPKPQKIEGLRGVHGVSSDNIVIVDAQTLLIPNFSYDGEAPDAKFWVGRGSKPSPQGIRVPDENGKEIPLRRYDKKTVVLTLPGDLTVFDIGHFGVWCEAFTVDFGHVRIPQTLNVPPSLKMLGVSPQKRARALPLIGELPHNTPNSLAQSKLNCEVLHDDLAFEVRWAVAGESIVIQLVAKLDDGEYMSFGLSGDTSKTEMVGGDVVVAWVDKQTLKGYAEDYYLEAKSQCSGPRGSCPDNNIAENTNNIRLLNAAMVNGYSIVTYQRPLKASDELDREVLTNQSQSIIWAVGPLNQRNEVSFHSQYTKKDHLLDFGRPAHWNCPLPDSDSTSQQSQSSGVVQTISSTTTTTTISPRRKQEDILIETTTRGRGNERRRGGNRDVNVRRRDEERTSARRRASNAVTTARPVPTPKPVSERNAWHIPAIQCYEPDDGVFYAQMGPTGGKRGYSAITGHVGWGISWYINGLLIPEINVVRGKTYTFVVEGGLNPEVPAKYHPFYITDDPIGGYEYKTPEERQNIRIFAGAKQTRDGKVFPTGVGRLCHWTHTGDMEADDFQSFGAFQRTLELRCDEGEPGVITWTPDAKTPDTVYYQCFTHRYLGWKINVVDSCNSQPEAEASEPEPVLALPNNGDLKSSSSIIVETRINPNDLFQTTQTKQIPDRPASLENSDYSYHDDLGSNLGQEGPDQYQKHFQSTSETPIISTFTPSSGSAIKTTISQMNVRKPLYNDNKVAIRRPVSVHRPPFMVKPHYSMRRPPSMYGPHKKTFFRVPIRKRPMNRPMIEKQHKVVRPKPINQHYAHKINPRPNKQKIIISSTTPNSITVKTESSSEQTFSSELISVINPLDELSTMRPAINTGFKPESVVIEGGFKPILTKGIQERIFKSDSDDSVQQEEIGVIKLNTKDNNQQFIEPFEPMFIPSPPDSQLLLNKKQNATKSFKRFPTLKKNQSILYIVKHIGRSTELNEPEDEMEDEIAMAAERVEAYYLPPDNKKSKPIDRIRKPSNIDIPPGSVVTFDGKTVSGSSLTAPVSEISGYESQSTRASEILRLSPQFGPFKGEIPPLETKNINIANLPQLNSQAVISRDLNAPAPAPPSNSGTQTTRLQPVSIQQFKSKIEIRSKRNAHHTPEHTAEQQMQKYNHSDSHKNEFNDTNNSSYISGNFYLIIYVFLTSFMNTYLHFK